jgi:penicillin-binding protein 1C
MKRVLLWSVFFSGLIISLFIFLTWRDLRPFPDDLMLRDSEVKKVQILDRANYPLTVTYQNDWNLHDHVSLHQIPETLQHIIILSEDQRFYEHSGADWSARWHALLQNLKAGRIVRGASTITEQTVRMLHPRPRTFWSRWVEGFEAYRLEQQFSKADILEFYLNQVPYASNRRGVVQAARHYFDRDLETLNLKEMVVLAVLVRSPSRLDLRHGNKDIRPSLKGLTERLLAQKLITEIEYQTILNSPLQLNDPPLPVQATHFANHLYRHSSHFITENQAKLHTTLDGQLQQKLQAILDQRLRSLVNRRVKHGAILVVDHAQNNEILAWVNSGIFSANLPVSQIDAITTPRQPGSALKPFLYAMALERGWHAATLINDAPLAEAVGTGLHHYRNYSRTYYGSLRLREALGNSLNTPAVRTVQYVGTSAFLMQLRELGFNSLNADVDFYGDGLALGNGEVTLLELVQAYTVLAKQGIFTPLKWLKNADNSKNNRLLFTPEVSSLIADILSDPDARRLEFGQGSLLHFPVQTAIKTGTSTDYRDAWAIGFNYRYTAGIWLGNLDQQPMLSISGASSPALILRAVFAELNRHQDTQALPLSPQLSAVEICRETGLIKKGHDDCNSRLEWFTTDHLIALQETSNNHVNQAEIKQIHLKQPAEYVQLALDPRIPEPQEAFALVLAEPLPKGKGKIEWLINQQIVGVTDLNTPRFLWPLQRGSHHAQARVIALSDSHGDSKEWLTPAVGFLVK